MLLDLFCAGALGYLLLGRVSEPRTLWLLRGYLLLVALGWLLQRYGNLPLTAKLIEALVLVCGLALAILLQGELRRLLELLGTGRLAVLMGSRPLICRKLAPLICWSTPPPSSPNAAAAA